MSVTLIGNKLKVEVLADESTKTQLTELNVKFDDLDSRVDTILTTPVESVSAQEIIDARDGETVLGNRLNKHEEYIKRKTDENNYALKTTKSSNIDKVAMVTFIDDDGSTEAIEEHLLPMVIEKGVKWVLAIPSSFISLANIDLFKQLQDLGCEIASHGKNHLDLTTLDDEELLEETKGSIEQLEQNGLYAENMVYPFGANNKKVRQITSKYFNCGITTNSGHTILNDIPIPQYNLRRVGLGSYFDGAGKDTLDFYKSVIDEAILKKQWVIFMNHVVSTSPEQHLIINDLVDYIKDNQVKIATVKEALETFGNSVFNGDYSGDIINDKYHIISNNCNEYKNNYARNEYTILTTIVSFPYGYSQKTYLSADSGATGFEAGLLETYRSIEDDVENGKYYSYQLYTTLSTNITRRRYVENDGSWSNFVNVDSGKLSPNIYTITSEPDDFPPQAITRVQTEDGTSYPNGVVGILETHNFTYVKRQKYYPKNKYIVWERYWDVGGGTWSPWVSNTLGLPKAEHNVDFGSVNAQSTNYRVVSVPGATYGDLVIAQPYTFLPSGVTIYANQYDSGLVQVAIVNATSSNIDIGEIQISIKVIRV